MALDRQDIRDLLRLLGEDADVRRELKQLLRDEQLEALTARVDQLTARVDELAQAQQRTEARLEQLTARVDQLTARVDELAQAQQRTEARLEQLTARVDQLAARVDQLAARVDQLAARVDELAQAQQRTEARLEQLADAMRRLADDVGTLKGRDWERTYREKAPAYFGTLVRRVRVLDHDQRAQLLEQIVERGDLTEHEADELERADIILTGRWKADGELVYIVAEVSAGVGPSDVERAAHRAGLLAKTGVRAVPVVAGEWIGPEATTLAEQAGVWQLTDGAATPPAAGRA